jgi:dTDP-glucose pyrophosphorylase
MATLTEATGTLIENVSSPPPQPLTLIMPMAGRGARFAAEGVQAPKPLIDLFGRPFFWWAVESVRRTISPVQIVFVVLDEHCKDFHIDRKILDYYPNAKIVSIPHVTSGAAETASIGVKAADFSGSIAINDCDHAFVAPQLADAIRALGNSAEAALLCFKSTNAAFSYAELGPDGTVIGTVEKKVVSPFAIAGCYMFANAGVFLRSYANYQNTCPYDELFISGIFNLMAERKSKIVKADVVYHVSFGTPEERSRVDRSAFDKALNW